LDDVSRDDAIQENTLKRNLTMKLALAGGTAALALGAAACEVDDSGTDPMMEDPVLEDDPFEQDTTGDLDG
jgi:hypothetical protein